MSDVQLVTVELCLTESQIEIIQSASSWNHDLESWIADKLGKVIEQQGKANSKARLIEFAKAAKTQLNLTRNREMYLEDVVRTMGIEFEVAEFGGLGKFLDLVNSRPKGARIPEGRMRRMVVGAKAPTRNAENAESAVK